MNKTLLNLKMNTYTDSIMPIRFRNFGGSIGIEWDKIEDSDFRLNDSMTKEGLEFVIAQEDLEYRKLRSRSHRWYETIFISKGDVILVLKDGKPLRCKHTWKRHLGAHKMQGRESRASQTAVQSIGKNYYESVYTFGTHQYGLQSTNGIKTAVNEEGLKVKYLHLSLCSSMHYMSGLKKLEERREHKEDNLKWATEDTIRNDFKRKMQTMYKNRLNDPITIRKKFFEARMLCLKKIQYGNLEEQSRFAGMLRNIIDKYKQYKQAKDNQNSWVDNYAVDFQQKYIDIVKDRDKWDWYRTTSFGA